LKKKFANGEHIDAIKSSLYLTNKFPDIFEYQNLSAILYAKIGEYEKSYALFKRLVSLGNPNASFFYNFVNLLVKINKLDMAVEFMQQVIDLKPNVLLSS